MEGEFSIGAGKGILKFDSFLSFPSHYPGRQLTAVSAGITFLGPAAVHGI
jgi:hypothetical protein